MKKHIKRLTALLLAMAMSLSLLSANVWAADSEPMEDESVSAQSSEGRAPEEEVPDEDAPAPEEDPPAQDESTPEEESPGADQSGEEDVTQEKESIPESGPEEDEAASEEESEEKEDNVGKSEELSGEENTEPDENVEQEEVAEESVNTQPEQSEPDAEEQEELEPMGSTMASATSISLGSTYYGSITQTTDKNYYRFTLSQSGRVNLVATAQMRWIYYKIYNLAGDQIWYTNSSWNSTTEQIATNESIDLTSGTYYFCVEKDGNTGNYSFALNFTSAQESFSETENGSNNSMNSANTVSVNSKYSGQIAKNDEKDFYRFTLNQSGRINLIATAKMSWIYYKIYNSAGDQIWYTNPSWNNTTEQIATNENIDLTRGTYYFCVEKDGNTGNYTFTLNYTSAGESFSETGNGSDNSISNANSISLNNTYYGQLAKNDEKDFYRFTIDRSGRVILTANAKIAWIYYRLYNAAGDQIWYTNPSWNNTTKQIVSNEKIDLSSGTYYLCVERDGNTGPYSFSLSQGSAPLMQNATISLSSTWYTYDGNRKEPNVTVKIDGEVLSFGNDYWVDYSNNINAGTATVTVTGTGEYSGTASTTFTIGKASGYVSASNVNKTCSKNKQSFYLSAYGSSDLSFKSNNKNISVNRYGLVTIKKQYAGKAVITITSAENGNYYAASKTITVKVMPSKTSLYGVYAETGGKIGVSWYWNGTGKGYQIQYSTDKKFRKGNKTKTIKSSDTTYTTIGKLKKGKKYFVRIRTKNGKNYSGWSKAKSVKTTKK